MKTSLSEKLKNISDKFDTNIFIYPAIPEKKLKNALKSYTFGQVQPEEIVILVDDTVFGSAKDGLIITEKCVCGHTSFDKPFFINFSEIETLAHNKGKLIVNGQQVCDLAVPGKAVCGALFSVLEAHLAEMKEADVPEKPVCELTLDDFVEMLEPAGVEEFAKAHPELHANLQGNYFANLCDYRRVCEGQLETFPESILKENGQEAFRDLLLYLPMLYLKAACLKGKWPIAEGIAKEWIMFKLILFTYSYFAKFALVNYEEEDKDKIFDIIFEVQEELLEPFCVKLENTPPCENFDPESVKKYMDAVATILTGEYFRRNFGHDACCNYICDYSLRDEFGEYNIFDPGMDKKLLGSYVDAIEQGTRILCSLILKK